MKKNNIFTLIVSIALMLAGFSSCIGDLDRFPENETTGENVYSTFEGYRGAIIKVYASLALTGNKGPSGKPDILGLDEGGNADFLRCFFIHQEQPTDVAHCIWNDPGVPGLNNINFSSANPFTMGLYNRCMTNIMYANEFIRNSTPAIVNGKGFTAANVAEISYFRAEARFLRAFHYWVLMDLFGNPPFVTEESELDILPPQIKRKDLFNYIESELKDLTDNNLMKEARANEYGRADKGAAWALLAKIYLNAEVYTGIAKYNEAVSYAENVITAGYGLKNDYERLFHADNNLNNPEAIFTINYDGRYTQGWGGVTFLVNCGSNKDYEADYAATLLSWGLTHPDRGWSGYRARKEFTEKFETGDKRFLFVGEEPSITNASEYTEGLATYKWRNITIDAAGNWGYGSHIYHPDIDFPLFRLADIYLIYAEAVKRGGTGSSTNALDYINALRERAFGNSVNNYASFTDISLEDILNERGFELYWEGHRRTDLIRFGMFTTSNYIWEWKGGTRNGRSVSPHYNLYPIPASDLMANPNLDQNLNY
jgi:hypothetical protein